jgi:hypothetical protein
MKKADVPAQHSLPGPSIRYGHKTKANQLRRKGYLARREEEFHGAGVPVAGRSGTANPRGDGEWAGAAGGGEGDSSSLSLRLRRCGLLIAGENIFGGAVARLLGPRLLRPAGFWLSAPSPEAGGLGFY